MLNASGQVVFDHFSNYFKRLYKPLWIEMKKTQSQFECFRDGHHPACALAECTRVLFYRTPLPDKSSAMPGTHVVDNQ